MTTKRNEKQNDIPTNAIKTKDLYKAVWRWHFYAGLIFMPFLLILAITGGIYLFKPQMEQFMYQDLYQVEAQGEVIPPSKQIETVMDRYPEANVDRYRPGEDTYRSAEVGITNDSSSLTVFVNPYTGEIVGELHDEERLMNKIEEIHGELMAGTTGDRMVELAACWALFLLSLVFTYGGLKGTRNYGVLCSRDFRKEKTF